MNQTYIGGKRGSECLHGDQGMGPFWVTVYVWKIVVAGVCGVIEIGERQIYERFAPGKVSYWTGCCCVWCRRVCGSYAANAMKLGSGVH